VEPEPAQKRVRRTKIAAPVDAAAADHAAGAPEASTASSATASVEDDDENGLDANGLSAYERERLENIRRNNAVLAELNLLDASAALRPKSARQPAASRGIKTKRVRAAAEPPRRSLRSQRVAPDVSLAGGVASESGDGTIRLSDGTTVRRGEGASVPAPSALPPVELAARAVNGREEDEEGADADRAVLEIVAAVRLGPLPIKKNLRAQSFIGSAVS